MKEELKEINKTLKKIEGKIEDKSSRLFDFSKLFDFEKIQEESRKKREEERNSEILRIQKIQTQSIKTQEGFTKIIALTACILALVAVYDFIENSSKDKTYFWVVSLIFFITIVGASIPLIKFIFKHAFEKEK